MHLAVIHTPAIRTPRDWLAALRDATPAHDGAPPALHGAIIPAADLINIASIAAGLSRFDAAAIVCDDSDPPAAVLRLASRIRESGLNAVIVRRACSLADRRRLAAAGFEVADASADTAYIAGVLAGIARCGAQVREVEAEAAISRQANDQAERWLRRADDEMQLAARLQHDMLPHRMPQIDGLEFGTLFRPAYYVGGDVYRVWRLDERRIGLFIADAMGHGLRAAMQSMILAHALVLKRTGPSGYELVPPGRALAELNRELLREHHEIARFATAVVAVIDTADWRVTLAGAGHPAPVLLGPGGARAISADGPALGAFDEAQFTETQFVLEPGQALLLHTDGLDAAVNAAAGRDPLSTAESPPAQIAGLLGIDASRPLAPQMTEANSRLDAVRGSLRAPDDIAVLAVRRAA